MKKKKVLILGVTGQDGSFMAKLLLDKKYLVYGFIRKSATGNTKNISDLIKNKNFIKCHGDLLDINSLSNVIKKIKPDEIYNFADQDHVRWSFEIPSYSFSVTGTSVINILEIIKNYSSRSKYSVNFHLSITLIFLPLSSWDNPNEKHKTVKNIILFILPS